MRSRLAGLLLFGSVLTWAAGACTFAGVSTVYMSIDTGGAQRRTIFYTDSSAIYCIAKFSSAKQDATLDFTIKQIGVFPWCKALTKPTTADEQTNDIYNIFALGEQTPGPGTETVVAAEILPNGVGSSIMCPGYIAPNLPSGNICSGSGTGQATAAAACVGEGIEYESEGADSGGPGFTCCASLVQGQSSSMMPSTIPYPAGIYSCNVTLDGVPAGSTEFTVEYPTYPNNSCPAPTVSNQSGSIKNVPCFCPEAPPVAGIPCYNWVPEGAGCPSNDTNFVCVCAESGVWECE